MSHAAAGLQWGGYKQILAPSPEAEAPTPHLQFSSALSGHCFIHLRITQDWQRTRLTLQVFLQLVKPPETGFWKDFQRSHSCTCTQLSVGLSGPSFRGKHERAQRTLGSRALLDPRQTHSCALQVFQEEVLSQATRGPSSHSECSVRLCSILLSQHKRRLPSLLVTSAERVFIIPHLAETFPQ